MSRNPSRRHGDSGSRFLDGCHKYGWAIGIIANLLVLGVFAGRMTQSIDDLRERLYRIESRVDQILLDHGK